MDSRSQEEQQLLVKALFLLSLGILIFNAADESIENKPINQAKKHITRHSSYIKCSKKRKREKIEISDLHEKLDIFERTGLFEEDFLNLYDIFQEKLSTRSFTTPAVQNCSLASPFRLLLVLHWLRHYPSYIDLGIIYKVSSSTVSREIHFLLPKLYDSLKQLWGDDIGSQDLEVSSYSRFSNVKGAIDATSHFRNRVHPFQSDYYRGDKRGHFITDQIICDIKGRVMKINLALGHNNDMGLFNLSGVDEWLEKEDITLLADGGYSKGNPRLVTPDEEKGTQWNNQQKSMRAIVEQVGGLCHNFSSTSSKFKQSPEIQELSIMCVWYIVSHYTKVYPLR